MAKKFSIREGLIGAVAISLIWRVVFTLIELGLAPGSTIPTGIALTFVIIYSTFTE